jgi:hypothetical protein
MINDRTITIGESEKVREKLILAYFKVLLEYLAEGTKKNHKDLSQFPGQDLKLSFVNTKQEI